MSSVNMNTKSFNNEEINLVKRIDIKLKVFVLEDCFSLRIGQTRMETAA